MLFKGVCRYTQWSSHLLTFFSIKLSKISSLSLTSVMLVFQDLDHFCGPPLNFIISTSFLKKRDENQIHCALAFCPHQLTAKEKGETNWYSFLVFLCLFFEVEAYYREDFNFSTALFILCLTCSGHSGNTYSSSSQSLEGEKMTHTICILFCFIFWCWVVSFLSLCTVLVLI